MTTPLIRVERGSEVGYQAPSTIIVWEPAAYWDLMDDADILAYLTEKTNETYDYDRNYMRYINRAECTEGNNQEILYRVINPATGVALVQSDVASMALWVYDLDTGTATATNVALTVNSCIYNTMQSWTVDATGYNVKVPVSGSYLPDGGKTYRVEVKVTPVSGTAFYLRHTELQVIETYST